MGKRYASWILVLALAVVRTSGRNVPNDTGTAVLNNNSDKKTPAEAGQLKDDKTFVAFGGLGGFGGVGGAAGIIGLPVLCGGIPTGAPGGTPAGGLGGMPAGGAGVTPAGGVFGIPACGLGWMPAGGLGGLGGLGGVGGTSGVSGSAVKPMAAGGSGLPLP